jgi:hypothetical protein
VQDRRVAAQDDRVPAVRRQPVEECLPAPGWRHLDAVDHPPFVVEHEHDYIALDDMEGLALAWVAVGTHERVPNECDQHLLHLIGVILVQADPGATGRRERRRGAQACEELAR